MISVIIAAYNEEKRITPSLFRIKEYMNGQGVDCEIIVVDDGSTDRTSKVVQNLIPDMPRMKVIRYDMNRGKGYALKTGVLVSEGEVVLLSDADLSTPIEELSKAQGPLCSVKLSRSSRGGDRTWERYSTGSSSSS